MSIVHDLKALSSAEDFFHYLDVPYDPQRLRVVRLHILSRMGSELTDADISGLSDEEARAKCREVLTLAYDSFLKSSPLEQRVFKVLKDAGTRHRAAFVPLTALKEG
jgi:nitrogenase-stabilizing/protective protein